MNAEQLAKEFLRQHGLVYRAQNPIPHGGIDVLCLQEGLISLLKEIQQRGSDGSTTSPDLRRRAELLAKIHALEFNWGSHTTLMQDCIRCQRIDVEISDALTTVQREEREQHHKIDREGEFTCKDCHNIEVLAKAGEREACHDVVHRVCPDQAHPCCNAIRARK